MYVHNFAFAPNDDKLHSKVFIADLRLKYHIVNHERGEINQTATGDPILDFVREGEIVLLLDLRIIVNLVKALCLLLFRLNGQNLWVAG